jgi:choline kinase
MKAIILAAGKGSRIKEFSKKKPKCFLKIKNIPIIKRQIDFLSQIGINNIIIVVGHLSNSFKYKNIKYVENKVYRNTEQLYSFFLTKKYLTNEDTIILFSDIIYDFDILKKIVQTKNENISIMIQKKWKEKYKNRFDHPKSQADKVFINEKGYVKKISKNLPEKHTNGEFLGILKIPKNSIKTIKIYLDLLKKNENIKRYQFHNYLNFLIKNRVQIKSCNTIKKFMEIDTLNDYKIAKTLFEN